MKPLAELQHIPIREIDLNMVQPKDRNQIDLLVEKIKESNFIAPCVVVPRGKSFVMADGHRRLMAAKTLGRTSIDCVLLKGDPVMAFMTLNAGSRPFKGSTWFAVWAKAKNREEAERLMPKVTQGHIRAMVEIFGEDRAIELGTTPYQKDSCVSPGIRQFIERLQRILSIHQGPMPTPRAIGEWVLKHRQTGVINEESRRDKILRPTSDKFRRCIQNDVPYRKIRQARPSSKKAERAA